MSFCPNCGTQTAEDQVFCHNCGYQLNGGQTQSNAGAQNNAQRGNSFADSVNSVINDIGNTDDHSASYSPADISAHKAVSVLAYIGILVLVPWFGYKYSPFARFHSNQGLVLFIANIAAGIVCSVVNGVFSMIHLGFISGILSGILGLIMLALAIMGIVYAAQGKAKELPLIGKIKILK